MMTITTHKIDMKAKMIFWVAIRRTKNAKTMEIAIPCMAEETKALSDGIQTHASGAT